MKKLIGFVFILSIFTTSALAQKLFYDSVKDAVKTWNSGDTFFPSDKGFPVVPRELVFAAGNSREQANDLIADVDLEMRKDYKETIEKVGQATFPILYARPTPDGGIYHLLINRSKWVSARPVPPLYQQLKSISHIPLAIFVIIAPYTKHPKNLQWVGPLQQFLNKIEIAKDHLKEANMPADAYNDNLFILNASIKFINDTLGAKSFTLDGFSAYSHSIIPQLVRNQNLAAQLQVYAFTRVLLKWKEMIGEDAWARMYVVCSSIWTVSKENVHELIIRNTMPPKVANRRVFVTSMPIKTLNEARNLIGRIVSDRVMAQTVFPKSSKRSRENTHSLSTSRDLISVAAREAIKDMNLKTQGNLFPQNITTDIYKPRLK